jgi:predicted kinase
MPDGRATLHLFCGKIASGKSTLAVKLAEAPSTILLCEDHWLAHLYPGEIQSVSEYVRCSGRLREAVGGHVVDLLRVGVSVVLDFPANTVAARTWMRSLFEQVDAAHQLHLLDVPDETCRARLQQRNASGIHDFAPSEADFALITRHFAPPSEAEGFDIVYCPVPGLR